MGLWDVKLSLYPYDSCSSPTYQPVWRVGDSVAIMQAPAFSWSPECEFKLMPEFRFSASNEPYI